jgi:CDP-diacylglycerol--glycerol-3-phosphate 3-phosphatidyltransferase
MALTAFGVLFSVAAGLAFWKGRFIVAAILMFAGGLCDMLDGSVARRAGTASRFGAFIDSSLDRYAEAAVFMGLLLHYRTGGSIFTTATAIVALTGSFMVSYTRARAEGLGVPCAVGIMERPERFLVIIVGALLGPRAMPYALAFLAVAANVTAVERMIHVRRETRGG